MTFGFFDPTLRTDPVRSSGVCATASRECGSEAMRVRRLGSRGAAGDAVKVLVSLSGQSPPRVPLRHGSTPRC